MSFRDDYLRGLDALYEYAPYFYRIMRFLGIPKSAPGIPTAQVTYNPQTKAIEFEINPELIDGISDENVAFVIAHEAYHVLLSHLGEVVMHDDYPDRKNLVTAHECIVNDNILHKLGLDKPEMSLIFGEQYGTDFSNFSTKEAYDYLTQNQDKSNDNNDENKNDNSNSEKGDSSNNSSGSGNSESNDDSKSEGGESSDSNSKNEPDDSSKGSDGGSNGSADNSDSSGRPSGSCGGIIIPEGFENEFNKSVGDSLKSAIDEMKAKGDHVPDEFMDWADQIADDSGVDVVGNYGIGNNNGSMFIGQTDDMNLDWKQILAKVNPNIMTSGGSKYKDDWSQPRRRMINSYPQIILPTRRKIKEADDNGGDVPTFILALDMSYSIPASLIAGLANLADSVPDKFIKVMPVTWSDYVLPFDTKTRAIVQRSGTNVDGVYAYSQKVAKEIKKQPYVFVITDGECRFNNNYSYSRDKITADPEVIKKFWSWGAITDRHKNTIKSYMGQYIDHDSVFDVNSFLV